MIKTKGNYWKKKTKKWISPAGTYDYIKISHIIEIGIVETKEMLKIFL